MRQVKFVLQPAPTPCSLPWLDSFQWHLAHIWYSALWARCGDEASVKRADCHRAEWRRRVPLNQTGGGAMYLPMRRRSCCGRRRRQMVEFYGATMGKEFGVGKKHLCVYWGRGMRLYVCVCGCIAVWLCGYASICTSRKRSLSRFSNATVIDASHVGDSFNAVVTVKRQQIKI